MFPIGDRAGRVIAFGGRIIGDGQPKYLNSPDSPLFEKGRVLYGWSAARAAVARAMQPIPTAPTDELDRHRRLHGRDRAAPRRLYDSAVAPLGTALTEFQLHELWRLATGAGPVLRRRRRRAARRGAGIAPGACRCCSRATACALPACRRARIPNSLIRHAGSAMPSRECSRAARPLAEMLWEVEVGAAADRHAGASCRSGASADGRR